MSDRKAVIKNADMSEEMQQDAVDCATQALEKYNIEKDIAAYIKKVKKRAAHKNSAKTQFYKKCILIEKIAFVQDFFLLRLIVFEYC